MKSIIKSLFGRKEPGSAFVMAIGFLAVLTLLVGAMVKAVTARVPVTFQDAGWHQARMAAEAGIDATLDLLNHDPAGLATGTAQWAGWKLADGATSVSGTHLALLGPADGATRISGSSVLIYTGTEILSSSGTLAYVSVNVRAVYPTYSGSSSPPWFVLRAMGTAPLSGPARNALDKMDIGLRRITLRNVRQNLLDELPVSGLRPAWWGQRPTASRIVEVIARPDIHSQFEYAMFTQKTMNWGRNGKFYTDSYNSHFSAGGDYPGGTINNDDPAAAHSNGDVGTNSSLPEAITTNGGIINGRAQTPTGDPGVDLVGNVTGGGYYQPGNCLDNAHRSFNHRMALLSRRPGHHCRHGVRLQPNQSPRQHCQRHCLLRNRLGDRGG